MVVEVRTLGGSARLEGGGCGRCGAADCGWVLLYETEGGGRARAGRANGREGTHARGLCALCNIRLRAMCNNPFRVGFCNTNPRAAAKS